MYSAYDFRLNSNFKGNFKKFELAIFQGKIYKWDTILNSNTDNLFFVITWTTLNILLACFLLKICWISRTSICSELFGDSLQVRAIRDTLYFKRFEQSQSWSWAWCIVKRDLFYLLDCVTSSELLFSDRRSKKKIKVKPGLVKYLSLHIIVFQYNR